MPSHPHRFPAAPPLAVLALALAATPARAGSFTAGLGLGWLWMDPSENLDSTWTAVPRLGYRLDDRWTLEADLGFAQGFTRTWGHGYDALTPRFNGLFTVVPGGSVEPFVAFGPGLVWKHVRRPDDTVSSQSPAGENYGNFKNPDADLLLNLGPGAWVHLAGALYLRADLRAMANLGTEPHGEIPDTFLDWELTGGLFYRPGGAARDSDRDGIPDASDSCPDEPEDLDDFYDTDGCPDEDNDDDGILDVDDDCPDDREDVDGFRDDDGCPDDDNDGDGLYDYEDGCPDDPEDVDGIEDEDGCPDHDIDGDGIGDDVDQCVDRPETFNGYQDRDGCPDEAPEKIKKFTGVIRGINFEVNSDVIKPSSYRVLDEAVAVLEEFPDLRIEVQGHTDSDGSEEYNLDLSARRAKAVVAYLVDHGIDPDRLEWVGYGESRPLVEERTAADKATNRRVEFRVLTDAPVEAE